MTPDTLYGEFEKDFARRKFSAGLLMAFVDLFKRLDVPALEAQDFSDILKVYPRRTQTSAGKNANTLIVAMPGGGTLSLRPFYNEAENFFRAVNKRFDYPSCAPHATQAWIDYRTWLDALATYSHMELDALRLRVAAFVLDTLKSQAFDPSSVKAEPPLFQAVLEGFDMTAKKGEPSGAVFQGIVFGFLRADNPHLQIEIDKVRTGSKRLQRVGDIDGWDGARLAISAEVKQFELKPVNVIDLHAFANAIGRRGALGIVVALEFKDDARGQLEALGVKTLDADDLRRIVQFWDPVKQRTATTSLVYYARHVEKNSSLGDRLDAFLTQVTPY